MVTGLINGQQYYVRMRAYNSIGRSLPTSRISVSPIAAIYDIIVTGGTASEAFAEAGTTVTLTANTSSEGQIFDKWEAVSGGVTFENAGLPTTTFTMPANDVEIRAIYKAIVPPHTHSYDNDYDEKCNICKEVRIAPKTPTVQFPDIKAGDWYKEFVDYAVAYGMFKGTDKGFEPNSKMDRAQFVQVLANLSGAPKDNSVDSGFTDVKSNQWYTSAIRWAKDNNIVAGYEGNTFRPNQQINRQEMCTMLVNYVNNYRHGSLAQIREYTSFADESAIEGWAKPFVQACYKAGLVSGKDGGKFAPKDVATRAEGATIFTNFHKAYIAN